MLAVAAFNLLEKSEKTTSMQVKRHMQAIDENAVSACCKIFKWFATWNQWKCLPGKIDRIRMASKGKSAMFGTIFTSSIENYLSESNRLFTNGAITVLGM